MFVLPLGLGTRLRRFPVVTFTIGLVWILVFVFDHSDRRIMHGIFDAVAQSGIRDASRDLFVQYCESHHGTPAKCRRYSVLVWTGYPAKAAATKAHAVHAHAHAHVRDARRRAATGKTEAAHAAEMTREFEAADTLRQKLADCGGSRRCFGYKNIVWRFQERDEIDRAAFVHLRAYPTYRHAVVAYRRALARLCARNLCLAKSNLNLTSLVAAQVRHGGWLHLFGNLFAFAVFGIYVEQRTSRVAYFAVLALGGTLGMAVHTYFFGGADTIALGGSANVSAVMGMFYVFFFRSRMRFLVWLPRKIYAGSTFFADVRYCFPLLFVLTDVAGGFDNGFADLQSAHVAHFAHLTGLAVGMLLGWLIVLARRLPMPLLYEGELKDMRDLERDRDLGHILRTASCMVAVNPDNVHAMEVAAGAFLRWVQTLPSAGNGVLYEQGKSFLAENLQKICAIDARRGELRYACKLLTQMPLYMPYRSYLGRLGQVNTLKLADYALTEGHPLLALRLYDFFLMRFPLARKCVAIEDTVASILDSLTPNQETIGTLMTFLTYHPDSMIGPRLGAWITNVRMRRA